MNRYVIYILFFAFFVIACVGNEERNGVVEIRLNQLGFYRNGSKVAIVTEAKSSPFFIVDSETDDTVYQNRPEEIRQSPFSKHSRTVLDFSDFQQSGNYYLTINGLKSKNFIISDSILKSLSKAVLKAFYYNRSGMDIEPVYSGGWSRRGGHWDTCVYVHGSAGTPSRPEGTVIKSPKGWYDSGDYNKYVATTCYSIAMVLGTGAEYADYFERLAVHIPESGRTGLPDLYNEMVYGLTWLKTMQDEDGGVYHKLTTSTYEPFVSPAQCNQKRYVVAKSVTATLGFASVMAQCYRLMQRLENRVELLDAAKKAFEWALQHPTQFYRQNEMNKLYKPEIVTNMYDDNFASDEFFWASVELYLATRETKYIDYIRRYQPKKYHAPAWNRVYAFGYYAMLQHRDSLLEEFIAPLNRSLLEHCDNLLSAKSESPFASPFGYVSWCFSWGSLAEGCCGGAISLMHAYRITGERKYLEAAIDNVDYILGRNATGYCFVTGFGYQRVMSPHHRLSYADDVEEPIPGMLVGGPNIGQEDVAMCGGYPSMIPDESYIDNSTSYASNGVGVNWNADLLYVVSSIEAEMSKKE